MSIRTVKARRNAALLIGSVLVAGAAVLGSASGASAESPDVDSFLSEVEAGGHVTGSGEGLVKLGNFVCQTMDNYESQGFSSIYEAEDYADWSLQQRGLTFEASFDIIVAAEKHLCSRYF